MMFTVKSNWQYHINTGICLVCLEFKSYLVQNFHQDSSHPTSIILVVTCKNNINMQNGSNESFKEKGVVKESGISK